MDEPTLQPVEPPPNGQQPAKRRSAWLVGGVGLLVILLAAAAYVGARWVSRPSAGGPGRGQAQFISNGTTFSIEPAAELPQGSPDLVGVLLRRQDNSLFLGTGRIRQRAEIGQVSAPSYDGPVQEVVVAHDTQIFRDETNFDAPPGGQSGKIRQVVKPAALDDIPTNSVVRVWGGKTGSRFIAQVLVYQGG